MLNKNSIAIVGARKCSKYGAKYSAKFAKELARADICIISGLANGIDAIAHTYSKSERGKTIAVIGSGFNNIYPKENILLYKEILEKKDFYNKVVVVNENDKLVLQEKKIFPIQYLCIVLTAVVLIIRILVGFIKK